MAKFFETLDVREGSGAWTRGPYGVDFIDRAFASVSVDICEPAYPLPDIPELPLGDDARPFAIIGYARVPTRCTPEDLSSISHDTMARVTEHRVSEAIWNGVSSVDDYTMYLNHSDIETVTRGATYPETLARVISRAFELSPEIDPVIHLGFEAALTLQFGLQNLGIPFVVPTGYPQDAVAVTDRKVTVHLTPIQTSQGIEIDVNRKQIELTRFASVEFDTTKAVRAAA